MTRSMKGGHRLAQQDEVPEGPGADEQDLQRRGPVSSELKDSSSIS